MDLKKFQSNKKYHDEVKHSCFVVHAPYYVSRYKITTLEAWYYNENNEINYLLVSPVETEYPEKEELAAKIAEINEIFIFVTNEYLMEDGCPESMVEMGKFNVHFNIK
jgi:hypothetical protein